MASGSALRDALDVMRSVERLSAHDQWCIVRFISLLSRAPEALRLRAQIELRSLIADAPTSQEECIAAIVELVETAERELDLDATCPSPRARSRPSPESGHSESPGFALPATFPRL